MTTVDRIRELTEQGMDVREIAETLGISRQGVHDAAKRHAVRLNPSKFVKENIVKQPQDYDAEVARLYHEGVSINGIMDIMNLSHHRVYASLIRSGVDRRRNAYRTIDREKVRESYLRTGRVRATAKEIGVTDASITRILIELGIYRPVGMNTQPHNSRDKAFVDEVERLINSGYSIEEAARNLSVGPTTIKRSLYNREHGIA